MFQVLAVHLYWLSFFVVQPCMVNSCSETSLKENDVKRLARTAGAHPAEELEANRLHQTRHPAA